MKKWRVATGFEIMVAIENAARGKFGDSPPAALPLDRRDSI